MNENAEILKEKEFQCPICSENLEIRMDKHEKPYCICDDCGVQLFIRKLAGIKRLIAKIKPFDFGLF